MTDILSNVEHEVIQRGDNKKIEGIEFDSRKIEKNFVFIAMKGELTDGNNYIEQAIERGSNYIISGSKKLDSIIKYPNITYVYVEKLRKQLGYIASNYYDYPQNKIKIIGITGTNGKTTSSFILESILTNSSRIGTTGNRILDEETPTANTTPESLELIKLIDKSVKKNVEYFIMEVSSHALEMGRVEMLKFDSAIFTNLTQDHLDFHGGMENYFQAKYKLFKMLKDNKSNGVINIDDEHGKRILDENKNFLSYSIKDKNANLYGEVISYKNNGMLVKIIYKNKEHTIKTKLLGEYNLYNLLGSIGALLNLGNDIEDILNKIDNLKSAPGRFEIVENDKEIMAIVDFAHTPDGLENITRAVKKVTKNKLITVFGAGGGRDHDKRKKMAKAAAKNSDFIIITSDNPRNEKPINIINEIEKGLIEINFDKEKYIIIENREEAIKYGALMSGIGDSLLVAGKGHEDYQVIGDTKIHFDDKEVIKKYL